jgi:hypothetical protein
MPSQPRRTRSAAVSKFVLAVCGVAGAASPSPAPGQASAPPAEAERPRLQAVRAAGPVSLDGRLDEAAWAGAPAAGGFRQIEPEPGSASRFDTTVRVLFDRESLYLGVFCRDSLGARGIRVEDLRRKFDLFRNDYVGVSLDALGDGRSVAAFQVTPYGTQREEQVQDDGSVFNTDWEAAWRVRTVVADSGWTAEVAIPWSSLRYDDARRAWGINFVRVARRSNETSGWSPWPRGASPHRMAYAGELVGLEPPPPARNLRVRPYVVAEGSGTGEAPSPLEGAEARAGGELTWSPRPNAALELTANTDFAQADVDRQVVNLTRFSVFFPERRQFFLENASLFGPDLRAQYGRFVVRPFFTRRIGLDGDGSTIPIQAGARYVQRDAHTSLGGLLVRQEAGAATGASTFAVGRATRNLGAVGRLGVLAAGRWDEAGAGASGTRSATAVVDAFTRVGPATALSAMVSASTPHAGRGHGAAGFVRISHDDGRLWAGFTGAVVTRDYDPAAGFVSRRDVVMTNPFVAYSWRPAWKPKWLRHVLPYAATNVYHSASDGRVMESFTEAYVDFHFHNGALIYPDVQHFRQRLETSFEPVRGVSIPAGSYSYWRYNLYGRTDPSAAVSGSANLLTGGYYDRTLDEASLSARVTPSPRASLGLTYDGSRVRGGGPTATTHLVGPELRLALDPRVQLTGFYQRSTEARQSSANVRLTWEFRPLSYLYVVYNDRAPFEERPGDDPVLPHQRSLIVKLTWLGQL